MEPLLCSTVLRMKSVPESLKRTIRWLIVHNFLLTSDKKACVETTPDIHCQLS